MLMIVFSLKTQEQKMISKIEMAVLQASKDQKQLVELKSMAKKVHYSMEFDSSRDICARNNVIMQCSDKNQLFSVDVKTLSPEKIYSDRKMTLEKIQVRMTFFIKKEDSFWSFLKSVQELFPDSIAMQLLSIERVFFNPKEGLLLKGRFHFDCYRILFSSEDR
jgi:hypothetical protein